MRTKIILAASLTTLLSACAEQQTQPVYVSPLEFKNYNCKQIAKEMAYTSAQYQQSNSSSEMGDVLTAGIMAYGISQGYGFTSDGEDPHVSYLKAKYEALHQASIQKNCD